MATWSHTCNGKTITMSLEKSCELCGTTYNDQIVRLYSLVPELPKHRERQIPVLFKTFKKNKQ